MRTIKWVSYAANSLEHRPRMLHKTDILPRQGNLWSFRFPSHLSALPSWPSDAFASSWKIHKSEGRKRLTSWLFSLSQRLMAHLSKGSSLRTSLYHLNLLARFLWAFPPSSLVFLKVFAAPGVEGICKVNGKLPGGADFCQSVHWVGREESVGPLLWKGA